MTYRSRRVVIALLSGLAIPAAMVAAAPSATAVTPAVTCNQNPIANSHTPAHFLVRNVPIRNGFFTGCSVIGEGQPGDSVTVHCLELNSNDVLWDFLTDHTIAKTGWSPDQFVGYSTTPARCS